MGIIQIYIMSVALAMDAFAVSICKGLSFQTMSWTKAIIVAAYFGIFQGVMPLIGYLLGSQFEAAISRFDYLVVFILLSYIGLNMIKSSREKVEDETIEIQLTAHQTRKEQVGFKTMIPLAIATSIDALAVGVTLSLLRVDIYFATLSIGIITFLLCIIGVKIGQTFGSKYKASAELFGGLILMMIALHSLLDHFF